MNNQFTLDSKHANINVSWKMVLANVITSMRVLELHAYKPAYRLTPKYIDSCCIKTHKLQSMFCLQIKAVSIILHQLYTLIVGLSLYTGMYTD